MDGPDRREPARERSSPISKIWNAPLAVHVLMLVVVLVGVVAATSQPDSFTTDEGSYEVQLRALDQGSWTWDAGTADLDHDGTHYPIAYSTRADDGWVPLMKHPLWPWTAYQASRVTGLEHAYDVLGSLAVLGAAVAAWFLAGTRDPRLRRGAFWLAGLGPVTVTATFGWAHAASAAAGGLAVLGAVLLVDRERRAGPLGAAPAAGLVAIGVALGILMRSEGFLFAIALALALPVAARSTGRSWRWSAASGAAVLVLAAAVYKLEDLWVRSIAGTGSETLLAKNGGGIAASGFLDARLKGAGRSLVDVEGAGASLFVLIAVVVAAIAAAYVVRGDRRWLARWHVAMAVVIVAFVLRVLTLTDLAIRGTLIAWPVLLIGLAAAGALLWQKLVLETVAVGLFVGAILATQYPDGGAIQWGGRFFAPAIVPLAVMAAVGLQRLLAADDTARAGSEPGAGAAGRSLPMGRALVGAVVVLPLVLGVWLCASNRSFMTRTYSQLDEQIQGLAVTPDAQIPRMMWRHDLPWLVVDELDEGADLSETLASLHDQADGPDQVTVVMNGYDLVHAGPVLEDGPWREAGRDEVNGLTVVHLER